MKFIIGKRVSVIRSADPTQIGLKGKVVLDSMRMLRLESEGRRIGIQKKGSVILSEDGEVIICDEMLGRLEDRIARGARY